MNDNEQNQKIRSRQSLSRVETKRASEDVGSSKKKRTDEESPSTSTSKAGKWVFRLVGIPLLILLFTYAGMVAGFVLIGKGSVSEALSLNTWTHLVKLVFY